MDWTLSSIEMYIQYNRNENHVGSTYHSCYFNDLFGEYNRVNMNIMLYTIWKKKTKIWILS